MLAGEPVFLYDIHRKDKHSKWGAEPWKNRWMTCDDIQEDLHELHSHERLTKKTLAFLDTKVWEHEKQLFLLRERMETYEKS